MAVSPNELSSTPDNNSSIGGFNIAEGCPAANLNNAMRYLAAQVRVAWDAIPSSATFVTATNAVFQNQPMVVSRGAVMHHSDPANTSGRFFIVPDGNVPSGLANGDIVIGV